MSEKCAIKRTGNNVVDSVQMAIMLNSHCREKEADLETLLKILKNFSQSLINLENGGSAEKKASDNFVPSIFVEPKFGKE